LVFRWRRQAGLLGKRACVKKADAVVVPVMLSAPAAAEPPPEIPRVPTADGGVIEIELAGGRRVRLSGPVDVQALKRVIAVLEGRRSRSLQASGSGWRQASFKVIRHVRPKLSCRVCETIVQAPMPSLPIERGKPGPGLLAHVLVGKYADHLPLYRQSEIYPEPRDVKSAQSMRRSNWASILPSNAMIRNPIQNWIRFSHAEHGFARMGSASRLR
jgi:hypothetical protein